VNLRLHLPVAGFIFVAGLVVGRRLGASNLRAQGEPAATPAGGRICFVGGLVVGRRLGGFQPSGRRAGPSCGYTCRWPDLICWRFGGWSSVGGLPTFGAQGRALLRLHLPVAGFIFVAGLVVGRRLRGFQPSGAG